MTRHWIEAMRLMSLHVSIAANFGNEYYDFKNGIDKKGRAGFRRGVTEGEITPKAMKAATSLAIGLLASNVLVVNNYRDMEDDASVGKRTTVVIFGRKVMGVVYLLSGFIGMSVMIPVWLGMPVWGFVVPLIYLTLHVDTWHRLIQSTGAAINPLLGRTAINLLIFALLFAIICAAGIGFAITTHE